MSTASNDVRELTIGELDTVAGAAEKHVVEFKMGVVKFQFDVKCDKIILWNGNDPIEVPK